MSNEQTVFGIDLGTTYSCIAYVDDYGRPVVVPNGDGLLTTASVVELGSTVVVGEEAKKNAVLSPDAVVSMVKRHMGEENWRFSYQGQEYTAEQISSFILKKVVEDAKNSVGHDITRVVITCPAYFGVNEREATAIAGRIAGLDVLEIINEPTAAAISYSMEKPDQQPPDQVALVYDLGGGTFDVTVIDIKAGAITVIATGGDHRLGGRDWDEEVVKYLSAQFMAETGAFDDPMSSPETLQDLWIQAEAAKRALSARTDTIARVTAQGQSAAIPLTRDKFDELTAALLARTVEYTRSTLADAAKKGYSRFDTLLLVGGSSKMPQVKDRLQREFGVEPRLFDPDQAVAKGAALYGFKLSIGQKIESLQQDSGMSAAQAQQTVASDMGVPLGLVGTVQNTTIRNVISHSFGIVAQNDAGRELIANLVLRQAPLPATEDQRFGTVSANQTSVHIRIMENDMSDSDVMDLTVGKELGSADLSLPAGLPAGAPIDVRFEINNQGRLEMTAREPSSGRTINTVVETSAVMSEDEINKATQLVRQTPMR